MKEYLRYSIEELCDDKEFVAWVLRGKNKDKWEHFLTENEDFVSTVTKATKIIELLRDKHVQIQDEAVLEIWKNVEAFNRDFKPQKIRFKRNSILKYAAIIVLVTGLIGFIGYKMLLPIQEPYVFSSVPNQNPDNSTQLYLTDGTTLDLENENSIIEVNNDDQIVIDKNRVVNLDENNSASEIQMNEVVVPYGKKSQLVLADGTKVWLNAGSKLAFTTKFSGKKREVNLEGEAYFEVAHLNNMPFFVKTNDVIVKVLGTKFNISAYQTDEMVETFLLEGKVALSDRKKMGLLNKETFLSPSHKATFNKNDNSILVENEPDADLAIAWTKGWFKFNQQNLTSVLNELQRYYNVQFEISENIKVDALITGKLDLKDSVVQVLNVLSDVAKIQYRIKEDTIFIEKIKKNRKERRP